MHSRYFATKICVLSREGVLFGEGPLREGHLE